MDKKLMRILSSKIVYPNLIGYGFDKLRGKHQNLMGWIIWAMTQENLSSGFSTKWDTNQPAQPQSLARIVKFDLLQVLIQFFPMSE